ncbi:MAG TPA: protein kinase, partial [Pseudomonas sp.]|nr:protein kinase [Pseudomonas sp.]
MCSPGSACMASSVAGAPPGVRPPSPPRGSDADAAGRDYCCAAVPSLSRTIMPLRLSYGEASAAGPRPENQDALR